MASESPEWCICTRCPVETNARRQVCCEQPEGYCFTATMAEELAPCLDLTVDDIQANGNLWRRGPPPESVEAMTPAQKRLIAYRKLFRVLHGIGTGGVQVVTPSCCRHAVSMAFPNEQEH